MVMLQKSDNQLYADIVRCSKQHSRSEFQPPFVAPHGERKVMKSPNSNGLSLQIAITGRPLLRKVQLQCKTECSRILYAGSCSVCFSWRCLFGCKRPRSENSWRWTEPWEGRLKASKHDCFTYISTFILILKIEKTFSFKPIHHFIL